MQPQQTCDDAEAGSVGALLRDPDYVAGVRKARELLDEGIFSQEEFDHEKSLLAKCVFSSVVLKC